MSSFNKMYWDPTLEPPYMQLTNNLQTVTALSNIISSEPTMYSLSGIPSKSGKFYWAIHMDSVINLTEYNAVGFGNAFSKTNQSNTYLRNSQSNIGYYENGKAYYNNNTTSIGQGFQTGDIVTVALDLANHRMWFYNNRLNIWTNTSNSNNSGDPSDLGSNGGGINTSFITNVNNDTFYPGVCVFATSSPPTIGAMTIARADVAQVPPGNGWTFYNIAPSKPNPTYSITHDQTFTTKNTAIGWSIHTNMQTHNVYNTYVFARKHSASYVITGLDFPLDADKDTFKSIIVTYLVKQLGITISTSIIKIYKTHDTVVFKIASKDGNLLSKGDYIDIGNILVNNSFITYINNSYNITYFTIRYPRTRTLNSENGNTLIFNKKQAIFNNVTFIKEVNLYHQMIRYKLNNGDYTFSVSKTKGVKIKIPGLYVMTVLSYQRFDLQTENPRFFINSKMMFQIHDSKGWLIRNPDPIFVGNNKVTLYLNYGDIIGINAIKEEGLLGSNKLKHIVFSGSLVIPYLNTSLITINSRNK